MTEKYFVSSDGEKPIKIYFDKSAFDSKSSYIDSFDEHGNLVTSYKFLLESSRYTTDF